MEIQHYAGPAGMTGRVSREWCRDNDPRLLSLIEGIAASKGDLARVACPPPAGEGQSVLGPVDEAMCQPERLTAVYTEPDSLFCAKFMCAPTFGSISATPRNVQSCLGRHPDWKKCLEAQGASFADIQACVNDPAHHGAAVFECFPGGI